MLHIDGARRWAIGSGGCLLVLLGCATLPASAAADTAKASEHTVILSIDPYWDRGTDSGTTAVGPTTNDAEIDGSTPSFLPSAGLTLTYLNQVGERLRAGASLRYFGQYSYEPDDSDDGDEVRLGTLLELGARGEFGFGIGPDMELLLGGELGLAMLLPSGELGDDIDGRIAQGYSVWDSPRIGLYGGPEAGARYALNEWLGARLGLAFLYEHLFLYDAETDSGNSSTSRDYSLTRVRLSLGIDARF